MPGRRPKQEPELKSKLEQEAELELELEPESPAPLLEEALRLRNLKLDPNTAQLLTEWLFTLSIHFVTQLQHPSSTERLPVLDFTAVLGIHTYSLSYRLAYVFTSSLAGLVWISQVLLLEHTLPLRPYITAELNWSAQDEYQEKLQRLRDIRRQYLCRGGFYSTSALMNMLAFGRAIARKEGRRTNISCSRGKDILALYDQQIPLSAFQQMIHSTIRSCKEQVQEAMFGWNPTVNFTAIQDSLVQNEPRWSFLKSPSNQLQNSFRYLHRRSLTGTGLASRGKWSLPRCQAYST